MLTDVALKALKPQAERYKKSDSGGLFLIIQPNGRKTWGLAFRVDSKQKFVSGGTYPKVSLKQARDWRDAIKAQLTLGMAPTAMPDTDGHGIKAPIFVPPPKRSSRSHVNGMPNGSQVGRLAMPA